MNDNVCEVERRSEGRDETKNGREREVARERERERTREGKSKRKKESNPAEVEEAESLYTSL